MRDCLDPDVLHAIGYAADDGLPQSWPELVACVRRQVEYGHPTPPPLPTAAFAVEEASEVLDEVLEGLLWTVFALRHTSAALKETIRLTWVGDRTHPRSEAEARTRMQAEIAQAVWMLLTLGNIYNLDIDAGLRAWGQTLIERTAARYEPPPPAN